MTEYIKYDDQIADHFQVPKEYVFQVYRDAQLSEAITWLHMTQMWFTITFLGALLFGLIALVSNWKSKSDKDLMSVFVNAFITGAVLCGTISLIGCIAMGSYTIMVANTEYMTWITYVGSLRLGT